MRSAGLLVEPLGRTERMLLEYRDTLGLLATSIGGAQHPAIGALLRALAHDGALWEALAPGPAVLVELHERSTLAIGLRRQLGQVPRGLELIERRLVRHALRSALGGLGPVSEGILQRLDAGASLEELASLSWSTLSSDGGRVSEAMRAGADGLGRLLERRGGVEELAHGRRMVVGELIGAVADHRHAVAGGWNGLAALWISTANGLSVRQV